ncbi:MAG TPA: hypothetical protein VFZ02_10240, partial [Ktedonobacteraceae bacterium]
RAFIRQSFESRLVMMQLVEPVPKLDAIALGCNLVMNWLGFHGVCFTFQLVMCFRVHPFRKQCWM